jgi:hypothetical protein
MQNVLYGLGTRDAVIVPSNEDADGRQPVV